MVEGEHGRWKGCILLSLNSFSMRLLESCFVLSRLEGHCCGCRGAWNSYVICLDSQTGRSKWLFISHCTSGHKAFPSKYCWALDNDCVLGKRLCPGCPSWLLLCGCWCRGWVLIWGSLMVFSLFLVGFHCFVLPLLRFFVSCLSSLGISALISLFYLSWCRLGVLVLDGMGLCFWYYC